MSNITALNSPQARVRPTNIIGTTGLKEHSGIIDEEFLHRLRGRNGVKLYREMAWNAPTIAAALQSINSLIRQAEWRVEPADESDAAKAEAAETEAALFEDMSTTFQDFLSEALSMLTYGWSYMETIYKVRRGQTKNPKTRSKFDDGKWGWRKFELRGQETLCRWIFDEEGGILGMEQLDYHNASQGPVVIPIQKALLFRTQAHKGNPEGFSMLRPAVIPYWYLKRIQEIEAIGVERDLAGMPIMEVPSELLLDDASSDDVAIRRCLEEFVTQVRRDERWGGLVPSETGPDGNPSGYKFKLMTTGGKRQIDTNEIVKRYESRMLMVFMAQFIILGQDRVGSQALAEKFSDLFALGLNTIMDIITTTFNRFAIRRRQQMNGVDESLDPKLVHGSVEAPNVKELGEAIQALTASGITLDDAAERQVLENMGLPVPAVEDEGENPKPKPPAQPEEKPEEEG